MKKQTFYDRHPSHFFFRLMAREKGEQKHSQIEDFKNQNQIAKTQKGFSFYFSDPSSYVLYTYASLISRELEIQIERANRKFNQKASDRLQ